MISKVNLRPCLVFTLLLRICPGAQFFQGFSGDSSILAKNGATFPDNAKQRIPDKSLLDNINQQVIHSANAANGVLRTVENGILCDKLSGLAKKPELSTLQNLDSKIVIPREDKIDGILRQNFQKTIPQRIDLITSTIIGEVISQKSDTVALNSFSKRIPQSVDDVLPKASLTNMSRRADSFLSRRPGGTFDGGFKPVTGTVCRKPALSQRLNLTSVAYDYPQ